MCFAKLVRRTTVEVRFGLDCPFLENICKGKDYGICL